MLYSSIFIFVVVAMAPSVRFHVAQKRKLTEHRMLIK